MKTIFLSLKHCYNVNELNDVANSLNSGNLVVFPTDTVYGLGAIYDNETAISKIFDIKKRSLNKPLNVLISNISMLKHLAKNVSSLDLKLMSNFWPGPLTIILDKKESVSNVITAGLNTIGVRIPDNRIALDLIDLVGKPLVTTSANISGNSSCIDASTAFDIFNNKVSYILDGGEASLKNASTIVRINKYKAEILREGNISLDDINSILYKEGI